MKSYRQHRCAAHHRTAQTFMKCAVPHAAWVDGRGDIALIAWCGTPTVRLYEAVEEAERAKRTIDLTACGGRCNRRHEIVRVVL